VETDGGEDPIVDVGGAEASLDEDEESLACERERERERLMPLLSSIENK
jgi:hypothetical protein